MIEKLLARLGILKIEKNHFVAGMGFLVQETTYRVLKVPVYTAYDIVKGESD